MTTNPSSTSISPTDLIGALDLLAEQNQWPRCLDKAKQHSAAVHHKYLAAYAAHLLRDNDYAGALALFNADPQSVSATSSSAAPPALPQNLNIYVRITVGCLGMSESNAQSAHIWPALRNFLHQLVLAFNNMDAAAAAQLRANDQRTVARFEDYLLVAHFYAMRSACRQVAALAPLADRLSVALLRYTELIPVDKAFYEAGTALRNAGRDGEAFVMLNHYLDVCDAIEAAATDGSGNDGGNQLLAVDHMDLTATDIPSEVPIPERMHLAEELDVHEDVRDWILAISLDQRVDQTLPVDADRGLYEASLAPGEQACLVSGYPVVATAMASAGRMPVTFQRSARLANREAWSRLTVAAKMTPNKDVSEVLAFVERWCGVANSMGN